MSIEINSVWDIDDGIEGVTAGQYRCLRVLYSINALVFFQLDSVTKLSRPILIMIDRFLCAVESGEAKKASYSAPDYI